MGVPTPLAAACVVGTGALLRPAAAARAWPAIGLAWPA